MSEVQSAVDVVCDVKPENDPNRRSILLGVALTGVIAAAAMLLRLIPGVGVLSPMFLSIGIAVVVHNFLGTPAAARPGVAFAMRRLLRIGIILLGLQLTLSQVIALGGAGLLIIAASLLATFLFTKWLGRRIGVDRGLAELIAAGTSVCGASAVIATNTVTRASDEDVAYAVACVTVFGSVAMFIYPFLPAFLGLDARAFGLWSGSSIHEIAQVVAAAFQDGETSGQSATVAKLTRVMMLAPLVLSLGVFAGRRVARGPSGAAEGAPMPWFVLGFIGLVLVNSLAPVPAAARDVVVAATTFLLSMALAAMGLETDLRKLRAKGVRPLFLGAAAWIFIGALSLILIKLARY